MKDKMKNSAARRFLLVSRELTAPDLWDHLPEIAGLAERERCHTLLFALSTVCDRGGKRELTRSRVFGNTKHLQQVILETGFVTREENIRTEWWERGVPQPQRIIRRFASSTEPKRRKEQLMAELRQRQRTDTMVLCCGEANIIRTSRKSRGPVDEHHFLKRLDAQGPRYIVNPWHTFSFRYEVNLKRKLLSQNGRVAISLWNKCRDFHHEARDPWIVFHDGERQVVTRLMRPISSRADVEVGVLEV